MATTSHHRQGAARPGRRAHRGGEQVIDLRDQSRPHDPKAHTDAAGAKPGGIQGRLRALGERWPWFGRTLDVKDRYGELHGDSLAAAVTLLAFLSLFPLLLVVIAVVGFFSAHSSSLGTDLVGRLGLSGSAAGTFTRALATARESRHAASIIGLVGLAWSGLGLVGALQYGYNQVWQVKARGWKDRLVGVVWLLGAAVILTASALLTVSIHALPGFFAPLSILAGIAVDTGLWLWTSHTLPNRDVGWRALLPGALFAAISFEILKLVGSIYVPRAVASSSALYGSLGVVFAVLAWLMIFGKLVIASEVVNVVLHERRAGTATGTIEIPNQPGISDGLETARSGQADRVTSI